MEERPAKRARHGSSSDPPSPPSPPSPRVSDDQDRFPDSLTRSVSPPPKKRSVRDAPTLLSSPFQLIRIDGLLNRYNRGTVTLKSLVGDPLLKECWNFNYMHDIEYIMDAFDEDVRDLVKLHIVHGNWKREDPSRLRLEAEASKHPNVSLHTAPMPEMFGTHHTKMMILLKHDDTAQVIIHTANSIPQDWTILTNALRFGHRVPGRPPLGSGERFKADLLDYLRAYDARRPTCKALVEELAKYDFGAVRAALVASVPGRHAARSSRPWGWLALRKALAEVPSQQGPADVVVQISSVATLGPKDAWLKDTFFGALSVTKAALASRPNFKVVFPTVDEVQRSVAGYRAGGSIHMRIQSPQQQKQLQYMKPMFHHWANDSPKGKELGEAKIQNSGRNRVVPHIKTYIRYGQHSIDWALLTSANLSKQAWGEAASASNEVRIASWEVGVLVWPELLCKDSAMVATFQANEPPREVAEETGKETVIGLRMPYSLPLQKYGGDEIPWVASMSYRQPDCLGGVWMD
ncbi:unnamed protein product [Parascedosporium putredinis]|uniref:Tyrosyl-DNA phosphodiesterase n=1 Tax=Parascedosporium putredinis TaxID=1442378 RepID=A0A9P1GW11_9PEZI|nr:unnamed protein product [Parascedosporium putredinis]CAI7988421.1 unnamed protein product [Parascedosporium putredinis]